MAIIDFDTCTWTDPWVQELPPMGKLLFNYLWTNNHKNVACLYTISYKTMRDETGLNQKQIEDTLSILYPKVIYDAEQHLVLVVNHVKRSYLRTGSISPKIIQAIRKNLLAAPQGHYFVGIFLKKYNELNIEYPYPIDTLSKGYQEGIDTLQVQERVQGSGKGKGKEGVQVEKKRPTDIPQDFNVSDRVKDWARGKGFTQLDDHLESFKLTVAAKGYKYIDWDAAFMRAVRGNWARIGEAHGRASPGSPQARPMDAAGRQLKVV